MSYGVSITVTGADLSAPARLALAPPRHGGS